MLLLCCSTAGAEEQHPTFQSLELPSDGLTAPSLLGLVDAFLTTREIEFAEAGISVSMPADATAGTVMMELRGYADDSVLGEVILLEVERSEGGYMLLEAGGLYLCARGENAETPQREPCP